MTKTISNQYIQGNLSSICQNDTGQVFFLATEIVTLKNGEKTNIYIWLPKSYSLKPGQVACTIPKGYSFVEVNKKFPALKRD